MNKSSYVVAGALLALSVAANAAPLTSASEKNVLFVTEKISATGVVSLKARTGPLTSSNEGYGINHMSTTLSSNRIPVGLPRINISGGQPTATGLPTRGTVLDTALPAIKNMYPQVNAQMAGYLRTYGMSSGWFNFRQDVDIDVAGVSERWSIYWDTFTDGKGRGTFGDPQLVPASPKYLYITYAQKAVDENFPASWQLPEGGLMKWQLRDSDFMPLTAMQTVDTGGYFDTIQAATEVVDAGIACLMDDANPGCSPGYISVKNLLDSTGAIGAVVDYGRRVSPKMVANPDGTEGPQMALSVDARTINYAGCSDATFRNTGRYGYALNNSVGRYFALSNGSPRVVSYAMIQEFTGVGVSPTQAYDYTLPVAKSQLNALNAVAIDPLGVSGYAAGTVLVQAADLPGLVYSAPLDSTGANGEQLGTFTSQPYTFDTGEDDYRFTANYRCNAGGGYEVDTFVAKKNNGAWTANTVITTPLTENAWTDVALSDHSPTRFSAYLDLANNQLKFKDKTMRTGVGAYAYHADRDYATSHNASALYVRQEIVAPGWFSCTPGYGPNCMVQEDGSAVTYSYGGGIDYYFRGWNINDNSIIEEGQGWSNPDPWTGG